MNTQQIIGFHNPDEEYGYLSNWYRSDFEKDPDRLGVKKWHGTNLLGYALMIVREQV